MNTHKNVDMEVFSQANIAKWEYVICQGLYACVMFDKNSFIDASCMLELQVINPSYLKGL